MLAPAQDSCDLAGMNAGAQAQRLRPNRAPEKLPTWVLRLSFVGIPLAVVLFVVGSFGLAVLMGARPLPGGAPPAPLACP